MEDLFAIVFLVMLISLLVGVCWFIGGFIIPIVKEFNNGNK